MFKKNYLKQYIKSLMVMPCMIVASLLLSACNNGDPVSAGAILTTTTVAPIDTLSESGGSFIVTNVGNRDAENIIVVPYNNQGLTNITGCTGNTLAPTESCTVTFNVPESSGSALLVVLYDGASTPNENTFSYINWYNSRGDYALASMSSESNPLLFAVNQTGSTTITVKNIGGYTLRNISIPDPVVLGGSGSATISNNYCAESSSLPIESSCTYKINVTDNVIESNQQIYLGFSGYYQGPESSNTLYNRSLLLEYSSQ